MLTGIVTPLAPMMTKKMTDVPIQLLIKSEKDSSSQYQGFSFNTRGMRNEWR